MQPTEQITDEISLKELIQKLGEWWRYLLSKWLVIVFCAMVGGGIGLLYAFIKKPEYKAVVTFALEDDKQLGGGISSALGLASTLGIDLGTSAGGAFSGANLIELMKSRKMVYKALLTSCNENSKREVLANQLLFITKLDKKLARNDDKYKGFKFPIDAHIENFSLEQDSVLFLLYDKLFDDDILSVTQKDKKISIISVEVNSKNESFSKAFAENLISNVAEFYIETKSKKARNNVAILQKQADSIRNELNDAISGVASTSDNTFNLNPALNIKRVPSTKRQVDVQANTAILTQLVTNLELAKVTLMKETPLIQLIDKPIFPLKKEKVSKIKASIIGGLIGFIAIIFYFIGNLFWKRMMI